MRFLTKHLIQVLPILFLLTITKVSFADRTDPIVEIPNSLPAQQIHRIIVEQASDLVDELEATTEQIDALEAEKESIKRNGVGTFGRIFKKTPEAEGERRALEIINSRLKQQKEKEKALKNKLKDSETHLNTLQRLQGSNPTLETSDFGIVPTGALHLETKSQADQSDFKRRKGMECAMYLKRGNSFMTLPGPTDRGGGELSRDELEMLRLISRNPKGNKDIKETIKIGMGVLQSRYADAWSREIAIDTLRSAWYSQYYLNKIPGNPPDDPATLGGLIEAPQEKEDEEIDDEDSPSSNSSGSSKSKSPSQKKPRISTRGQNINNETGLRFFGYANCNATMLYHLNKQNDSQPYCYVPTTGIDTASQMTTNYLSSMMAIGSHIPADSRSGDDDSSSYWGSGLSTNSGPQTGKRSSRSKSRSRSRSSSNSSSGSSLSSSSSGDDELEARLNALKAGRQSNSDTQAAAAAPLTTQVVATDTQKTQVKRVKKKKVRRVRKRVPTKRHHTSPSSGGSYYSANVTRLTPPAPPPPRRAPARTRGPQESSTSTSGSSFSDDLTKLAAGPTKKVKKKKKHHVRKSAATNSPAPLSDDAEFFDPFTTGSNSPYSSSGSSFSGPVLFVPGGEVENGSNWGIPALPQTPDHSLSD